MNKLLPLAVALAFLSAATCHAQRGTMKPESAARMQASRVAPPGPPVRIETEREPTAFGVASKLSNADAMFELFNPLAPADPAKEKENIPETPIDKKRPGFRGLIFLKLTW